VASGADWPRRLGRAVGVLLVLSVVALVVWLIVADPLEPYWERQKSTYDPVLKRMRCLEGNGELSELTPPCLIVTLKGQRAIEKRIEACEASGREHDACADEAWTWMRQRAPK
jgi:hypothetical protein